MNTLTNTPKEELIVWLLEHDVDITIERGIVENIVAVKVELQTE